MRTCGRSLEPNNPPSMEGRRELVADAALLLRLVDDDPLDWPPNQFLNVDRPSVSPDITDGCEGVHWECA